MNLVEIIPLTVLFVIYLIAKWDSIRLYKQLHPDEEFSIIADQTYLWRKVDSSNPLAKKYKRRRSQIFGIIGLMLLFQLVYAYFFVWEF